MNKPEINKTTSEVSAFWQNLDANFTASFQLVHPGKSSFAEWEKCTDVDRCVIIIVLPSVPSVSVFS